LARGIADDVHLAPERGPVEQQRDVRVLGDLARLARPQRGGEDERVVLEALQRDGPRGRARALADGHERDRSRSRHTVLARFGEPGAEQLERLARARLDVDARAHAHSVRQVSSSE
jgi:hypothetical protein